MLSQTLNGGVGLLRCVESHSFAFRRRALVNHLKYLLLMCVLLKRAELIIRISGSYLFSLPKVLVYFYSSRGKHKTDKNLGGEKTEK